MSLKHPQMLVCPKCGEIFEVTIWDFLIRHNDPEVADRLMTGEFFNIKCPKCGNVEPYFYDMVYLDMECQTMMQYVPLKGRESTQEVAQREAEQHLQSLLAIKEDTPAPIFDLMANAAFRVVTSAFDFTDKARILRAKLDDRIIELMKFMIFRTTKKTIPDHKILAIAFEDDEKNGLGFVLLGPDEWVGRLDLFQEVYEELQERCRRLLPNFESNAEVMVDEAWAKRAFDILGWRRSRDDSFVRGSTLNGTARKKNYESEFSGVALTVYRAATELTEHGCKRLLMAFGFYGLNASEPARSKEADACGSTLFSRIIETLSDRFAPDGRGLDDATVLRLKSIVEMFIKEGFDFRTQEGKPGARALWAFLHFPSRFFVDALLGEFLKAGANPTVLLSQPYLDHSNALEYAKEQFVHVYKRRLNDFKRLSCWYSIYMKLHAVANNEVASNEKVLDCRPLEFVKDCILKSVSFVPEHKGDMIEWGRANDQSIVGTFKGWIHLVFEGFDAYVNVWTGVLTHVKPIGYRENPETDISGPFQDYIGREIIDFKRGFFIGRMRYVGIFFDGGKILSFQGDALDPFTPRKEEIGSFFLYNKTSKKRNLAEELNAGGRRHSSASSSARTKKTRSTST